MKRMILTLITMMGIAAGTYAAQKTDEFTTKSGKKVTFTCIKHASIRIQYDGLEIQVDPVGMFVKPETDYALFPKANLILITHEHHDHFDREAIAALHSNVTTTYMNPSVYNLYHNGFALKNGEVKDYRNDIRVEAVPAYNTTEGRESFHPKGRDNGYVLTLDGLRIYIAGDTEDIPEMAELKDIDIAFLPCNQPYTMTVEQLVKAAKVIKPRVLFPYHYGTTAVNRIVMMLAGSGIDVRIRDYQ